MVVAGREEEPLGGQAPPSAGSLPTSLAGRTRAEGGRPAAPSLNCKQLEWEMKSGLAPWVPGAGFAGFKGSSDLHTQGRCPSLFLMLRR